MKHEFKQRNKTFFASIGLLLTTAIWGFSFVIVKDSLSYISAFYMMAFRFTIASVILSLCFAKKNLHIDRTLVKHGAVLGLYIFFAYAFQTIGCAYTTAGKNAFLTTTYVVLVPLISWPLRKKMPSVINFIAAIVALFGIALLALTESVSNFSMNKGDVLTLICGIFYSLHILYIEKYTKKESAIALTIFQFLFVAIFSWVAALVFDGSVPLGVLKNGRVIFSLLYLGIFSTMIAYALQNICQKYVSSSLVALLLSFEAVFGVLFSVIFLHDVFTLRMILGCVLIFVAVLLSQVKLGEGRSVCG